MKYQKILLVIFTIFGVFLSGLFSNSLDKTNLSCRRVKEVAASPVKLPLSLAGYGWTKKDSHVLTLSLTPDGDTHLVYHKESQPGYLLDATSSREEVDLTLTGNHVLSCTRQFRLRLASTQDSVIDILVTPEMFGALREKFPDDFTPDGSVLVLSFANYDIYGNTFETVRIRQKP
ncbi:MAG: hypothetical protein NTZ48_04015 [Candidatus Omnitrophica bacterium]|nr:hypothetical protein [Candidatus Omnitrophota bacterium]